MDGYFTKWWLDWLPPRRNIHILLYGTLLYILTFAVATIYHYQTIESIVFISLNWATKQEINNNNNNENKKKQQEKTYLRPRLQFYRVSRKKIDCNFVSINWRLMFEMLKQFSINNKYTPFSRGLCYIMRKKPIPNIPEHYFVKQTTTPCVLLCISLRVRVPGDRKARFESSVFLTS